MALLLKTMVEAYRYGKYDLADPRTADWFLVKSPIPVMFIVTMYLLVVYELLPTFMQNRKAYNLRKVLVVYNLVQIALNGYIIFTGVCSLHTLDVRCSPVDYSNDPHALNFARLTWFYYMVKLVDMLDTVFFILRKKFNQASFLHVYHHFGVVVMGWVGTKYVAGGESIFLGFINSFVHVIMYTYYMYIAWKPEERETINRWKKRVTQLQLVQFMALLCLYTPKIFTSCKFSKFLLLFVVPQNIAMICMFGEFYYKAYIKAKPANPIINGKSIKHVE